MAPFTAGQDLARDFFDGEIGIVAPATEGCAEHQQRPLRSHLIGEFLQLLVSEPGGGHIDKVLFGGVAMLPVNGVRRCIGETLQFAQGLGKHRRVVGLIDDPVTPAVLFQQ